MEAHVAGPGEVDAEVVVVVDPQGVVPAITAASPVTCLVTVRRNVPLAHSALLTVALVALATIAARKVTSPGSAPRDPQVTLAVARMTESAITVERVVTCRGTAPMADVPVKSATNVEVQIICNATVPRTLEVAMVVVTLPNAATTVTRSVTSQETVPSRHRRVISIEESSSAQEPN